MLSPVRDLMRGRRDLVGNFQRDRLDSMTIPVNQVARPNLQAADLNRAAEIEDMGISVGHRYTSCEHLEAGKPDLVNIAHGSVGDQSQASQS